MLVALLLESLHRILRATDLGELVAGPGGGAPDVRSVEAFLHGVAADAAGLTAAGATFGDAVREGGRWTHLRQLYEEVSGFFRHELPPELRVWAPTLLEVRRGPAAAALRRCLQAASADARLSPKDQALAAAVLAVGDHALGLIAELAPAHPPGAPAPPQAQPPAPASGQGVEALPGLVDALLGELAGQRDALRRALNPAGDAP